MTKDKKKKKKDKAGKSRLTQLEAWTNNRLVADVVAAALVATASALKDSKKAKALAASAGDELEKLAREGSERGNAMWKLALEVGRRAIDEIGGGVKAPKAAKAPKAPKAPKPPKGPGAPKVARKKSGTKPAKRSATKSGK
jgi:hypothetical protein